MPLGPVVIIKACVPLHRVSAVAAAQVQRRQCGHKRCSAQKRFTARCDPGALGGGEVHIDANVRALHCNRGKAQRAQSGKPSTTNLSALVAAGVTGNCPALKNKLLAKIGQVRGGDASNESEDRSLMRCTSCGNPCPCPLLFCDS